MSSINDATASPPSSALQTDKYPVLAVRLLAGWRTDFLVIPDTKKNLHYRRGRGSQPDIE